MEDYDWDCYISSNVGEGKRRKYRLKKQKQKKFREFNQDFSENNVDPS